MFKKIKEFFTGKPAPVETQATEVPYKVETPLVKLGPEPTPAIEAKAVVEFVPAGTEATVAAPVVEATPAKAKKAPAAKKAPGAKKPRAPKAK
jgi:hypothetical protein